MATGPPTWRQADLSGARELYEELIRYFATYEEVVALVADTVTSTEADTFASFIVHIFETLGESRVVPIIKALVQHEFLNNLSQPATIMRGNCPASKVQTVYSRQVGKEYLELVLGDILRDVIVASEAGEDFNINPQQVGDEKAKKNVESLKKRATLLLNRMLSPNIRDRMPRSIRAIAALTAQMCIAHYPSGVAPLVGGFINLRFFSPCICTPWIYNIVSRVPGDRARKNLIMLGKVLQQISNGLVQSKKEPAFLQLEEFIMSFVPEMEKYLNALAVDPGLVKILENLPDPSADASIPLRRNASRRRIGIRINTSHDSLPIPTSSGHTTPKRRSVMDLSTDSDSIESSSTNPHADAWQDILKTRPLARTDINIFEFDLDELWGLHRVLYQYKAKLSLAIEASSSIPPQVKKQFVNHLNNLGAPPSWTKAPVFGRDGLEQSDLILDDSKGLPEGLTRQQREHYSSLNMFYIGKPNKKNIPVFYLITARVPETLINNEFPSLYLFISGIIRQAVGDKPYALVLDTSWSHYSAKFLTTMIFKFKEVVEYAYPLRKQLSAVYIVHPSTIISEMIPFLRSLFPAWNKAVICYQYKALEDHILAANIQLPVESIGFFTKAFFVTKVNQKGRRQVRLIKFTANSLLNIDPKNHSLQNEKLLSDIESITCPNNEEILITFVTTSISKSKGGIFNTKNISFLNSAADSRYRHYICKSKQERDQIIEEIFRIAFYSETIRWPLEYQVSKVPTRLSHSLTLQMTRTYKITLDSLIILDASSIKKELPLVGIKSVAVGTSGADALNTLKLEFKEGLGRDGKSKIIICRSVDQANSLKSLLAHQARLVRLNIGA